MSDTNLPPHPHHQQYHIEEAHVRKRHFSAIWLIPVLAAIIAGYLGWRSQAEHGPLITIHFKTAQNIVPGQTQLRYKAVTLGTVENIELKPNLSGVIIKARMTSSAKPILNDHARFWVVRPSFNSGNVANLETLVTGSYIEIEPGMPGDNDSGKNEFNGLESPPADRKDEPGTSFVLQADKMDSLNIGSPIYYRGIEVGEVLGYKADNAFDPIALQIFVRAPYDQYVREKSVFWNISGVSLTFGPSGVHMASQSLHALLAGGVAFMTPQSAKDDKPAPSDTMFLIYADKATADSAQYSARIPYVTYLDGSVRDLAADSPVMLYGLQVGQVTNVKLIYDDQKNQLRVRVAFEIQPDRAFGTISDPHNHSGEIIKRLVQSGMRINVESSNFILGRKMLTLQFDPNAVSAETADENGVTVVPGQTGSTDNMIDAVTSVANKLNQIPFDQIGANVNHLVATADKTLAGPEMQQAVHSLSVALSNAAELTQKANKDMTPALERLPQISAQLQTAVEHANSLLTGLDNGYGQNSDFERNTKRVLDQVNDAARSIRLLSDYLERHPEALLKGKTNPKDDPYPPAKDKP